MKRRRRNCSKWERFDCKVNGHFGMIGKYKTWGGWVEDLIMHVYRYVPNLSASEYEANLQVISTTGSVQVNKIIENKWENVVNLWLVEILVCIQQHWRPWSTWISKQLAFYAERDQAHLVHITRRISFPWTTLISHYPISLFFNFSHDPLWIHLSGKIHKTRMAVPTISRYPSIIHHLPGEIFWCSWLVKRWKDG